MTTKDGSLILGQSIQVVTPNEEHRVVLDEKSLQEVLLRDDVKDLPVVVVSVAGAHRRISCIFSSFQYNESEKGEGDWLGAADETVKRFFGREGSKLTTGIYLWSEPFKASLPSGEKVAVLLMDTQGTSDRTYTVKDNATVFALSTMLSSVLIYNISQNIEEDDLQHLQLFLEYGRVAKDNLVGKPFQRLQFLVRDWSFPHDYPYGPVGGQQLLDKRLKVHEGQHLEQHITGCFEEATCFLMPHPGMKVRTDSHFTGKLSDIDPEYQTHLNQLVPLLLSSENLVQKKIGGQTVKTKDLLSYFKSYVEVFNSDTFQIPTIISEVRKNI
ncbi:atlastin-like [Trichoplusia ni]|uniref:Atlastin-like n=1 Tax=Trichoplusia ni TaxID=7111 RepID=A0A7E5WRB3_TRINI|nr:atlastin-like [Trichoplusia ni]XP_026743324.1 atlastin-like [Trichoplusia ni]